VKTCYGVVSTTLSTTNKPIPIGEGIIPIIKLKQIIIPE
jgi:hypothetical protein